MTAGEDFKKPSATVKNRRRRPPIPYWSSRRRPPIPNILKDEMRDVRTQLQSLAKDVLGTQALNVQTLNQNSLTPVKVDSDKDQRLRDSLPESSTLVPAPKVSPMPKVTMQGYSDNFLEGPGAFVRQPVEISQSEHNWPVSRHVNSVPAAGTTRSDVTSEQTLPLKDKEVEGSKQTLPLKDKEVEGSKQTPALKDKEVEGSDDKCIRSNPSLGFVAPSKSGSLLKLKDTGHQAKAFDRKRGMTESLGLSQRYSTVDTPFSISNRRAKSQTQRGVGRSTWKMSKEGRRASVHSDTKSTKNWESKIPYQKPGPPKSILMSQSSSLVSDYRDSIVHSETIRTANTFFGNSGASMLRNPIVAVEQVAPFSPISPYNHCIARRPTVQSPFCGEVGTSKANVIQNMNAPSHRGYTDQLWVQQSNHHDGGLIFTNGGNQQLGVGAGVPIYYFRPPGASIIYGNEIPQNNGFLPQQFAHQPGVILQPQQTLNPMAYHQPQTTFYQPYSFPYQF